MKIKLKNGESFEYISIVDNGTSNTTATLTPNVLYKWGTVASLTITFASVSDESFVHEYHFMFTSGSTPTTLSLPSGIVWENGVVPNIEANATYEVSVINNLGCIKKFV